MSIPAEVCDLQTRLRPLNDTSVLSDPNLRRAAVMVLLYPSSSGISLLLTERPHSLSQHAGQISLPGGAAEPEDSDLMHTALRESHEELGIHANAVVVLGKLNDVDVRVSGYTMTPFVGWCDDRPRMSVDPAEVAAVVSVPISSLIASGALREETWDMRGSIWRVCLYRFDGRAVWGATARVLGDLAARWQRLDGARHPTPGSVHALQPRS